MPPKETEKRGVGRPPSAAVRSREAIALPIANPSAELDLQSSTSPAPQRSAQRSAPEYWDNADWETYPPGHYSDFENRHSFPTIGQTTQQPTVRSVVDRQRVATVQRSPVNQATSRSTSARATSSVAPTAPVATTQSSSQTAAVSALSQTPSQTQSQTQSQTPSQTQSQTPSDLWALISNLAESVSATSQSVNALRQTVEGIQQANTAPSEATSVTSESVLEPRSILTPKMDLMRIFKVPSHTSSPQDIEHTLMSWKLRFELPLKQERNRQEIRAIFRTIGVLLSGEISESIREAIVVSLSRCEELTLLETHGSSYATTWAHQIFLRTDDSQVLASAHAAALLASGKSQSSDVTKRGGSSRRPSKRRRHRAPGGSGDPA